VPSGCSIHEIDDARAIIDVLGKPVRGQMVAAGGISIGISTISAPAARENRAGHFSRDPS
jgi:hypothetical protein